MTYLVALKRKQENRDKDIITGGRANAVGAPESLGRRVLGGVIQLEDIPQVNGQCARVGARTMMDRYHLRGQVSARQFDACARIVAWWRAAGSRRISVSDSGVRIPRGSDIGKHQAMRRNDLNEAFNAIGPRLALVVVHVCLCDEAASDWGEHHRGRETNGLAILRLALDSLADHWGFSSE